MAARRAKIESSRPIEELEQTLGHRFRRRALLELALTHRSLAFESQPQMQPDADSDNERMEFVGDAVLGLTVAEALYRRFPMAREGDLTRLRASLVSRRSLGEVAARIGLGEFLLLGKGEEQSGGRRKPAMLANALEAVAAALYLDGGAEAAQRFVQQHLLEPMLPELEAALAAGMKLGGAMGDHKSALQEHMQATGAGQPKYALTDESGPDHNKRFRVEVRAADGSGGWVALAAAAGSTKKEAQQSAAMLALEKLLAQNAGGAA